MPEKLLKGRSGGKCQAQALDKQQKWHAPTFEVHEETVVKRRPGRPRKDAPPPTCQKFRVHLIIPQPDSGKLQAERRRRSTFVLGTDDQCLGARELLETYKGQDQAERGFRMDERRPAPRCLLCPKAGSRRRDRHAACARATTRALALILPHLDERQRRLLLAAEAKVLGHGGVSRVAAVSGVSRPTVRRGLAELSRPALAAGRVRRAGGGRKRLSVKDPELVSALDALVDSTTRGDPVAPLRWTCKSTPTTGTYAHRAGTSDGPSCRRRTLTCARLQSPGQRQDSGGCPTPGSQCPLPLPERASRGVPSRRAADDLGGRQEEGTHRRPLVYAVSGP